MQTCAEYQTTTMALWPMRHYSFDFFFFFVLINTYFMTGPQREEHEQSNDVNISVYSLYKEWKSMHYKSWDPAWIISLVMPWLWRNCQRLRRIADNRKTVSQTGSPAYCRKLPLWDWLAQNTCKKTNEMWMQKNPTSICCRPPQHSLFTEACLSNIHDPMRPFSSFTHLNLQK